jgi:crotonobetainyl-CoA:carnitine CoA-transferase CaiB-like acyl-CoA transferase
MFEDQAAAANDTRPLPLAGIRVVDFSWIVAGPQATRILADLGAEVIRVENESHMDSVRLGHQPDPAKRGPNGGGVFNNLNRNKLSITANLHHPKGREVVERLISKSDIVVENFSAGVFERLGLGWEQLRALNPRIIYLSISGFGHSGRDAGYVTWGPTAQAVSGLTRMSGLPGHPPAGWGFSYLDHTAGYYGVIAVLMALHERERSGEGQYIDIAQVECGIYQCGVPILDYQVNGRRYEPVGNRSRGPALAPHGVYPCDGDDRWIAIVAETDGHWTAICDVLGGLADVRRFATNALRLTHQDELDAAIAAQTRRFDCHELTYLLQGRRVPAGAVQNTRDKMEADPQLGERCFFPSTSHPVLGERHFEGFPMRFSNARWELQRPAPLFGEHTMQVLTGLLGYSEADVTAMMEEAAV